MKISLMGFLASGLLIMACQAQAGEGTGASSVYDFKVKTIEGTVKDLGDYKGQVLLIVNTASQCGFTPQYAGLERLYERYKSRGFVVLAFPSNDFLGQEPGSDSSIKQFCALNYRTSFPLFSKIDVRGDNMAPLYKYLTSTPGFSGNITWNFNKFLVDRHGKVINRFVSKMDPMYPLIEEDVLRALAQ